MEYTFAKGVGALIMYKTITAEKSGATMTVTLNNPPVNIMTMQMMRELTEVLESVSHTKVIVIRGEGKCFSAGADVKEHKVEFLQEFTNVLGEFFLTLNKVEIPMISAVHGMALGGGFELATFCDLTYASESAKLGQPEIKLGVFPPIAAVLFPRTSGLKRCFDVLLSGRTLTAREARDYGLVNEVFADDKIFEDVNKIAEGLAQLSLPALISCKKAIKKVAHMHFEEGLKQVEKVYMYETMQTEDAIEGLNAFLEKRKPVWRDK